MKFHVIILIFYCLALMTGYILGRTGSKKKKLSANAKNNNRYLKMPIDDTLRRKNKFSSRQDDSLRTNRLTKFENRFLDGEMPMLPNDFSGGPNLRRNLKNITYQPFPWFGDERAPLQKEDWFEDHRSYEPQFSYRTSFYEDFPHGISSTGGSIPEAQLSDWGHRVKKLATPTSILRYTTVKPKAGRRRSVNLRTKHQALKKVQMTTAQPLKATTQKRVKVKTSKNARKAKATTKNGQKRAEMMTTPKPSKDKLPALSESIEVLKEYYKNHCKTPTEIKGQICQSAQDKISKSEGKPVGGSTEKPSRRFCNPVRESTAKLCLRLRKMEKKHSVVNSTEVLTKLFNDLNCGERIDSRECDVILQTIADSV